MTFKVKRDMYIWVVLPSNINREYGFSTLELALAFIQSVRNNK